MPKALYSGIKTFWGRNSPSVGQALAGHAGHLFVLCPRDREGSTSGHGVVGNGLQRVQLEGWPDALRASRP